MRALKILNEIPTTFKVPMPSGSVVILGDLLFAAGQRTKDKLQLPVQFQIAVYASEQDFLDGAKPVPAQSLSDFPNGVVSGGLDVDKYYNGQSTELEALDYVKAKFEALYQGKVQVIEINDVDVPFIGK